MIRIRIRTVVLAAVFLFYPMQAFAEQVLGQAMSEDSRVSTITEEDEEGSQDFLTQLKDRFGWRITILGFGNYRDVETGSVLNADNRLEISRYQTELNIRPDLRFDAPRLELSIKPRARFVYEKWRDGGPRDGESESDAEFFVNEWLARLMITESLFVSYGRERLLWGPSYLISPSNPFTRDNGRNNPKIEVPGMDYGRLIWIPNPAWALSLIVNTDEGRRDSDTDQGSLIRVPDPTLLTPTINGTNAASRVPPGEFEPIYALKLDYTGQSRYFSLIPSYREGAGSSDRSSEWRLGFFGGWSASDALLLYMEGNVLIDFESEPSAFSLNRELNGATEQETGDIDILAGISYTFQLGPTISLEYYHNEGGCTDPIHECLPPLGGADLDDILIRTDYGMVQFVDTDVMNVLEIIIRWIWDMNDGSHRTIGILEYAMGTHVNLFVIGDYFSASDDDEFGSTLNYNIFAGVEVTF